jgi:hypothetical protein
MVDLMTAKEKLLHAIRQLPDDVTPEDLIRELDYVVTILSRLDGAKSEETISHEDARRRMARWLK